MKKIISLILIAIISLWGYCGVVKNWQGPKVMAAGSTALVAGQTAKRIVLKNIMLTVANAGYLYFYSGTAPTGTAISNKFYFGANAGISTLDWDNLDFITASGAGLGIWTSADLGSDLMYEYEIVNAVE